MNCNYFPINNLPLWDKTIPVNNQTISLQNFTVNIYQTHFATITLIPSNVSQKRVWNFVLSGIISNYTIIYDLSNVLSEGYNITFEGLVYGTLQIGNQSYIANDYMKSIIDLKQKTITFVIQNIQLTENVSIFYNVFLNDDAILKTDYIAVSTIIGGKNITYIKFRLSNILYSSYSIGGIPNIN
jgi:hypothetical protein